MECLKCDKKTAETQVFCDSCLEGMDAYPVKPDIYIQLPNRPDLVQPKKSGRKRRALSPEEQVVALSRRNRKLVATVVLLALLLCAAGAAIYFLITSPADLELGKNYTFNQFFN